MRRRIIFGVIIVIVLVSAVRLVRTRKAQLMSQKASTVAMVPVKTGQVTRGDFLGERISYGVISSERQAGVRARTAGAVTQILAREGDMVSQGDTILELDGTTEAPQAGRQATAKAIENLKRSVAGMNQTRANLKSTRDNDRMLYENNAISAQQTEASENRFNEAGVQLASIKSELAGQEMQLSLFTVTAPFDGVIAAVQVQIGDIVAPMQPVLNIEDPSPCKITATVSSSDLTRMKAGNPATLVHNGVSINATIGRLHPSLGKTGTGKIDITLEKTPFGLPLGSSVEVRLGVDIMSDVLLVPANAVLEGVETTRVHVVESDTVRVVAVEVLASSGNISAVSGDLKPGNNLVLGSDSLLMRMANGVHVAPLGGK
jgi:RND family efflux transporter MFP subunit